MTGGFCGEPLIEWRSSCAVDGVCTVANCVGRELAPHVKKHGGKLIPESMKKDKDGRSNMDGAMVVAASGMQGKVKLHFCYLQGVYKIFSESINCPLTCSPILLCNITTTNLIVIVFFTIGKCKIGHYCKVEGKDA